MEPHLLHTKEAAQLTTTLPSCLDKCQKSANITANKQQANVSEGRIIIIIIISKQTSQAASELAPPAAYPEHHCISLTAARAPGQYGTLTFNTMHIPNRTVTVYIAKIRTLGAVQHVHATRPAKVCIRNICITASEHVHCRS